MKHRTKKLDRWVILELIGWAGIASLLGTDIFLKVICHWETIFTSGASTTSPVQITNTALLMFSASIRLVQVLWPQRHADASTSDDSPQGSNP